jgi:hypothetical protein
MPTVQLRRYQLRPGEMDAFIDWWAGGILGVRQQFGFTVLFAYADASTNQFVWAVQTDGDDAQFDEIELRYRDSPERAAVFRDTPDRIEETFVTKVRVVYDGTSLY